MPGIAVIAAFNPYNYGMYSVDLAAEHFFSNLGAPFSPVVTQCRTRTGRLRFRLLRDPDDFAEFDSVVYWGDFLNNPMFGADDYVTREARRHKVRDPEQAWENWCRLYLQLKQRHPQLRIFALGGCFLGADGPALARTGGAFQEFIQSATLVTPREARSLEVVQRLAPAPHVVPGMDCAWLLPFPAQPAPPTAAPYFVAFLGRTLRRQNHGFLDELARRTGLRMVWIDWNNLRPPRFLAHWNFERMHRWIAGAQFVVTDTYHLVVNALNRSVRTICLYDAEQRGSDGTCGDLKKQALVAQAGAAARLVEVRDPASLSRRIQEQMEACNSDVAKRAFENIAHRRHDYVTTLRAALKSSPPVQPVAIAGGIS